MNRAKSTRSASRPGTALVLVVAMILCAAPTFAASPSQDLDFESLTQKVFSLDWSFVKRLGAIFFGSPEPVQTIQEESGGYIDPDGQSLKVTGSARITSVSPLERETEL